MTSTAESLIAFVGGLIAGSFVDRRRPPRAARDVDRRPALAMPRLRRPDRRLRQRAGALLAAAAGSGPLLRRPISPLYPLTELVRRGCCSRRPSSSTGTIPPRSAIDLVFVTMLAAITLTDLERRIIPNKILLAGAVLCLAIAVPTDPGGLPERAIAAAAAGGLLFAVALAYPAGMGLGDVKLTATMGLFLGRAVAPAILVALLAGSARRPGADRPPRLQRPQDGDPVRPLPRPRRGRRHARRRPADRPLPGLSPLPGSWSRSPSGRVRVSSTVARLDLQQLDPVGPCRWLP